MRVLDLSLEIDSNLQVFPGSPQPLFIKWTKYEVHSYDSEIMMMSTHTGTHLDAPSHFVPQTTSIDMIGVDRLVSPALLVHVPKAANELITPSDLRDIENIDQGISIIFRTGWLHRMIAKRDYMISNPGLSVATAKFLAEKKVNAVGIDGPSIDIGSDRHFSTHKTLLDKGILIVENLCNLESLQHKDNFTLLINPLKLKGASGSPVRALAILDNQDSMGP
ncbi:MAG TPA: cyclase family protein [Nitrososphaeraceae archaeon]|nr:cyclase family protein [Nitrososphaeraceae archaeon]